MGADAARKVASYEEVLAAPEHEIAEVVDGELHLQPRPARAHARAVSRMLVRLGGLFDPGDGGFGGWILLAEPELHLGPEPQILVPDLAGWRRERMPEFEDGAFFELAPDWVCEILSPGTKRLDRGRKADLYAREGVHHLWLFDVDAPQIEAFELVGAHWQRLGAFEAPDARIPPFDAVPLDVPRLLEGVKRAPA